MREMLGNMAALATSPQELAAQKFLGDVLTKTSPIGQNIAYQLQRGHGKKLSDPHSLA